MKPEIDLHKIEENLKAELTSPSTREKPNPKCPYRFSIRRYTGARISTYDTDIPNLHTEIHINPKLIRTQGQLDQTIADCRHAITGY